MAKQDSISIRIARSSPIELDRFTIGLLAFASQYEKFVKQRHPKMASSESSLLINSVSEGSIVVDLIGGLTPLFAGLNDILVFVDFIRSLEGKFDILRKPGGRLDDATTAELKDLGNVAQTIANAPDSTAEIKAMEYESTTGQRTVRAAIHFNNRQARAIGENITAQLNERAAETNQYTGMLMRLFQANLSDPAPDRSSGEKGIIEALDPQPRRLIYANDLAAQKIKGAWVTGVNPFNLGFTVDVDVQMVNGKLKAYRIMDVQNVFDLDEDTEGYVGHESLAAQLPPPDDS